MCYCLHIHLPQDPVAIFWYDPSSTTEELVQVRAASVTSNFNAPWLLSPAHLPQISPEDLDTPLPLSAVALKRVPEEFQNYYASS
jgi:hypothetical protein